MKMQDNVNALLVLVQVTVPSRLQDNGTFLLVTSYSVQDPCTIVNFDHVCIIFTHASTNYRGECSYFARILK